MRPTLLALLLSCCTVYREPDGHTFAQIGGRVHVATPRFEMIADNQNSFRDATRMAASLGMASIASGVLKAQDASKAATDKAAIEAGTKAKEIEAGAEAARLGQEVQIKMIEAGL